LLQQGSILLWQVALRGFISSSAISSISVLTSPRCCHLMQDWSAHALSAMYNWLCSRLIDYSVGYHCLFCLAESSGENFPVPLFIWTFNHSFLLLIARWIFLLIMVWIMALQ
jgi:hypothetical protein